MAHIILRYTGRDKQSLWLLGLQYYWPHSATGRDRAEKSRCLCEACVLGIYLADRATHIRYK